MDDYSIIRDLLETWRSTTDWVKFVMLVAVPAWLACLLWLVLMYRADRRAMLTDERQTLTDSDVRELVEAEMCRIVAEWERGRQAREQEDWRLTDTVLKRIGEP